MARPLSHTPAEVPDESTRQEVDEFLLALAESGLLRALTGAIRAYPELAGQVARRLDPEDAESVAVLVRLVTVPRPEGARRLAAGLRRARSGAARALATGTPPSLLDLARLARHEDVRRGIAALLAALGGLGAGLGASGTDRGPRDDSAATVVVGPG